MAEGERKPGEQHAPVPASAPPGAVPSAAPAANLLALQSGMGNAAFARTLARQQPPQPPGTAPGASAKTAKGLTREDFEPVSFDPAIGTPNQLEAKPGAGDTVDLTAPQVTAQAHVKMKKQDPPADPAAASAPDKPKNATVGFVQTVLSSRRTFLYTEGGTPGGKVGVELRDAVPDGTRDARATKGQSAIGGGPVEGSGFAPFYQQPSSLSADQETDVVFTDHTTQSGIKLTLKGTDEKLYTLSQVVGGDHFRLSVGAVDQGEGKKDPIHLAAKEWRVPWDMTLDANHSAKGGQIGKEDYKGKLEDISPATGWSDRDAQQFRWPRDEAEAEKLDTYSLIKGIPYAERWDVNAWMMMSRVLRARNPSFSVKVDLKENPDPYSQIGLTIRGPRTATRSAREWGTGDQSFSFRMLDLFDPQDLRVGMTLQIELTRDGGTVNTFPWNWPYAALAPVRVAWSKKDGAEAPRGTMSDAERKGATEVTTEMIVSGTSFG
ncbi:MAG: hypothetical protein ABW060_13450 [Solirubrobacteraceae bacterium]